MTPTIGLGPGPGAGPGPVDPKRRRGFVVERDLPTVIWLAAVVVVALLSGQLPAPRWLLFHLLLLGALTHSILVWSQHFADALLHTAPTGRVLGARRARLVLCNGGVAVVIIAVPAAQWEVVTGGAAAVVAAIGWHGASLVGQLRHGLGSRFAATVRYYIAAAALVPLGITFGVLMVRGLPEAWHERLMVAHIGVNVLGWIGLTVLGTLVTLWPTMLRTRISPVAEKAARRALPVLILGVLVVAAGCLAGLRPVAGIGFLGYAVGIGFLLVPFVTVARTKPPRHFATWSVAAAIVWFALLVVALGIGTLAGSDWMVVHRLAEWLTPGLAAGFGAQVLLGALSYLVPVVLGGGPRATRATSIELDRGGALRIAVTNTAGLLYLLPVPGLVRTVLGILAAASLAAFLPLLGRALYVAHRARTPAPAGRAEADTGRAAVAAERTVATPATADPATRSDTAAAATSDPAATSTTSHARAVPGAPAAARPRGRSALADDRPPGQRTGLAMAGIVLVVLTVAATMALSPHGVGGDPGATSGGPVTPTGQTTEVTVTAKDMRFTPETVTVPRGNRLVIHLVNTDAGSPHDLVLATGVSSPLLNPGQRATVDAGVIGADIEGWCSVPGHRQMGMVFHIRVAGSPQATSSPGASGTDDSAASHLDFSASPPPGFSAHDPVLPPLESSRVHRVTMRVSDVDAEVAPGVRQDLWVYNGTMPGPTLHGRVGDRFVIKLVNDTDMGHSIDFHAGQTAPDQAMRTIPPGGSLTYEFTATHAGIWLYHCSTMPMSLHIANGMFGAVVIDPPDLPSVAKSYLLVQSELYLGQQDGPADLAKVKAATPDAVVFNGYANQYDHHQPTVRAGERVRIWVLNAGPNLDTDFHVVGGQFDTVFAEGAYLLRRGNAEHGGSQVLSLGPAQGGFVELTFPQPGHYPFVTHRMIDAERGAHGIINVTA